MNKKRIFLDQKQIELAQDYFRQGCSVDRVAAMVGVDRSVIGRYRKEGQEGFPPLRVREKDEGDWW